jgi:hypothetical protein
MDEKRAKTQYIPVNGAKDIKKAMAHPCKRCAIATQ